MAIVSKRCRMTYIWQPIKSRPGLYKTRIGTMCLESKAYSGEAFKSSWLLGYSSDWKTREWPYRKLSSKYSVKLAPSSRWKKWEPEFSFQENTETTVLWKSCPLPSASMLDSLVQKHHGRASCFLWLHSHIHTQHMANSALQEQHQMSTSSSLGSSVLVQMQKTPEAQFPECSDES